MGLDRVEVRVREVVDGGGLFAREGGFSTTSSVASPSTSDRPRFLRDVEAFPSGCTEADADRVARRGGMDPRAKDRRKRVEIDTRHKTNCFT